MINAVFSLLVGLCLVGVLLYILIDAETVRTLFLTKRVKRSYHKFANNKLEALAFDIDKKLENK